ncbi:MAG: NAD+ synthase [Candidatus Nanopelagicaceae bacterium]
MTGQSMTQMRIGLAQINPRVGDIEHNIALIREYVGKAQHSGVHLLLFPEMVVTGYPIEDLTHRSSLQRESVAATNHLAASLETEGFGEMAVVVGYLDQSENGKSARNCAAVIHRGQVRARYVKRHLPNYGVFDEYRNFTPGESTLLFRHCGVDVAIAICEDIWQEGAAMAEVAARNPGLVVVINGSPYERKKDDQRRDLVARRAMQIGAPLCYVNMTGGQDDLVFDGDSIVVDAAGRVVARAPQFEDGLMVVDLDLIANSTTSDLVITDGPLPPYEKLVPGVAVKLEEEAEIWSALVMGLRDYVKKNGFESVVLGLSGGIDSAVVATLAVDALGKESVHGVAMPSKYSSEHSMEDAKQLAINLGIHFSVIEIQPVVDAFLRSFEMTGLAEENVQARVRGTTLMGLSNQHGHLVLATGNKSELAVGYSTLYGDAVGGFAPIKDIFKSDVWRLAKWRNRYAEGEGERAPIPSNSITKEPSAELRPDQRDSDSLPPYPILDQILTIYIEANGSIDAITGAGFAPELALRVITLVDRAEYKRRQYPPGTKVSHLAFGKDRRLPLTSSWRERI